ncbi:MAG: cytochrome c [bacterium]|nr:cytochrome c [bacterium]
MKKQSAFLWLFFVIVCVGFAYISGESPLFAQDPEPTPVILPETADLALGAQLFALHCTECHGVNGAGDGEQVEMRRVPYPGNFLDPAQTEGKTPEDYLAIITNGVPDSSMSAWGGTFTDEELLAVTMYVYTLHENPPISAEVTPEVTQAPAPRPSAQGTISGLITVGTAGAVLPPDTIVTLHVFDPFAQAETTFTAPIDANNNYRFEDVTITQGDYYFATVSFAGRNYGNQPVEGSSEFPNMDFPITVYETTTDANVISIENIVVQIQPSQGLLRFTQVVQILNSSDRLYVGTVPVDDTRNITIEMPLPIGAVVTEIIQSDQFLVDNSAFKITDTRPILPNQDHLIVVTYMMPYENDAVMDFPVQNRFNGEIRVLVSTDELRVLGNGFTALGKETLGNTEYSVYGATLDLIPNDIVRYELSGRVTGVGDFPQTTNTSARPVDANAISSDNLPLLMVIILGGIVVIVVVGVLLINRNRKDTQLPTQEDSE